MVKWNLIIPIKSLEAAKSRLQPASILDRSNLALAFAIDVAEAAFACPAVGRVIVVTQDQLAHQLLTEHGAECIWDPAPGVGGVSDSSPGPLNAALVLGFTLAATRWPELPSVAMTADLPALRSAELGAVLSACSGWDRAFVPDRSGRGTTLLSVAAGVQPRPAFGHDSASAHRSSGAHDLAELAGPSVRCDVDVAADLIAALQLGVGEHTAAALVSASPALLPVALESLDAIP